LGSDDHRLAGGACRCNQRRREIVSKEAFAIVGNHERVAGLELDQGHIANSGQILFGQRGRILAVGA
jgi:hypothetical protein